MTLTADQVALVAGGLLLLWLLGPERCNYPKGEQPHRGCLHRGAALFWNCRSHGVHPLVRLMARLGGAELPHRRVCEKCKARTTFVRVSDTGIPILGCERYPACKGMRRLA